jgi:sortase A
MKTASNVFGIVALLTLAYWLVTNVNTRRYQVREMSRFTRERSSEIGGNTPRGSVEQPARPMAARGSAIGVLEIPRLGLSAIVVEGAEDRDLKFGPGHIAGTSSPGDGGNVGVAGHRDTFFRPLRSIRRDDAITITTRENELHYKVVSVQIVEPEDTQVLYPTERETLTLVTCYPFDFVGPAPKRFIVTADCTDCRR